MIPKVLRRKRKMFGQCSFSALARYTMTKADHVESYNLVKMDGWRSLAKQMDAVRRLNRGSDDPRYHFMISCSKFDYPTNDHLVRAAKIVIDKVGGRSHQSIVAIHRDRSHVHCHVVLNRIHPLTGKRLNVYHDFAALELACRQAEADFGWPADRGRFRSEIKDGKAILLALTPEEWDARRASRKHRRAKTSTDILLERHHGKGSLLDSTSQPKMDYWKKKLDDAKNWTEVVAFLHKHNLRYYPVRGGARITDINTGGAIRASAMGAGFSLASMQRKLGEVPRSIRFSVLELSIRASIAEFDKSADQKVKDDKPQTALAIAFTSFFDGQGLDGFDRLPFLTRAARKTTVDRPSARFFYDDNMPSDFTKLRQAWHDETLSTEADLDHFFLVDDLVVPLFDAAGLRGFSMSSSQDVIGVGGVGRIMADPASIVVTQNALSALEIMSEENVSIIVAPDPRFLESILPSSPNVTIDATHTSAAWVEAAYEVPSTENVPIYCPKLPRRTLSRDDFTI